MKIVRIVSLGEGKHTKLILEKNGREISAVWFGVGSSQLTFEVGDLIDVLFQLNINEYQKLAMTTLNPELSKKDVLINSVMGLCGESGEAIDIVKKWLAHGHELDKEHLKKELGDIAWYLAEAATALDMDLEDILQANIDKLKRRYPEGFSTANSVNRREGDE
jgi:NTP pyrophosphatase (non-canonical NTP hydrolase)